MQDLFVAILSVITAAFIVLFACAIYGIILGLPVMICWNYVMPVFGLTTLTYWQSAALAALMFIFFKGNKSETKTD